MHIEVCDTWRKKSEGLQRRSHLPHDHILLFTAIGSNQIFHMRNVRFPIVITAVDHKGIVLEKTTLMPEVDTFRTPIGTAHVVEASLDFTERNNIKVGSKFPNLEIGEINAKL